MYDAEADVPKQLLLNWLQKKSPADAMATTTAKSRTNLNIFTKLICLGFFVCCSAHLLVDRARNL